MTVLATVMMIFSLVVVWGGLVVSILYLRNHPSPYSDLDEPDESDETVGAVPPAAGTKVSGQNS